MTSVFSRFIRRSSLAAAVLALPFAAANAQVAGVDAATGATDQQLKTWHENLKNYSPLESGCFETSYPSVQWQKVSCGQEPAFVTGHERAAALAAAKLQARDAKLPLETAGNGNDYVAQTGGITQSGLGTFPSVAGITTEKGTGVAAFGGGGDLGSNEYSLQLNTDINPSSTACAALGYSSCYVWEQFVYSSAYGRYAAEIFIQNWVFPSAADYKAHHCPSGWQDASSTGEPACVKNSAAALAPTVAPTGANLASVKLSGSVVNGGNDTLIYTYGSKAYTTTEPDSTVHASLWWKNSEFNVVGNGGGSEAVFNKGASIAVNLTVHDGTTNAPACLANSGTTGETNNLNLGKCATAAGASPSISFTESD